MINLLPQSEKKIFRQKQSEKLAMIIGIIVLVGLVCLFLIIFSIKIYILGQGAWQKFTFENAKKEMESEEFKNFKALMLRHNETLNEVNLFYKNQAYSNRALDIILEISKPQGLYFTKISVDAVRGEKNIISATISGASDTRDNLAIFKKNIEAEKRIASVYFPPESWVSAKDINFNITLGISKTEVGNENE